MIRQWHRGLYGRFVEEEIRPIVACDVDLYIA